MFEDAESQKISDSPKNLTSWVKYSNLEGGMSYAVPEAGFKESEIKQLLELSGSPSDNIIRYDQVTKNADKKGLLKDGWVKIDTDGNGKSDEELYIGGTDPKKPYEGIVGKLRDPKRINNPVVPEEYRKKIDE